MLLEDPDPRLVVPGGSGHSLRARSSLRSPVRQGIPKGSSTHSQANESGYPSRQGEPLAHLGFILAATKNNAANCIPAVPASGGYDAFTISAKVSPLDFPDVWFDSGVLQLTDSLHHQAATRFVVIRVLVAIDSIGLRLRCGEQQLEHKHTSATVSIVGQSLQTAGLVFGSAHSPSGL
jgi:hypothetical protein